ncbi:MAG TPA: bifunctional [glutamine synthetase] adenylyltransferase/[glutamine synthetase]-adenylyl-L-tyrosine phosphorylase [Xanthobacteraceae bacterium]|nr:bifunctional [glutamine synthetase] adenylyltransferase/[glutamine synthetase]-adenylyl-L-tyrosine phosphorylase [Xanthobacteraceae bacterium]
MTVPADRHSLASRIAAPHALANDAGRIRVGEWLGERADCEAMLAVRGILATHPPVRTLIEAMASSSVHLWDLMRTDAARLVRLLETDPDESLAALRAVAADMRPDAADAEAMHLLRLMKAEAALLIALADIGGVWGVMRVTAALTEVADTAVTAALRHVLRQAAHAGKLALPDPADLENGCGLFVIAMGKMGAFELNYSSDIDLMIFFDPQVAALASGIEAGSLFVRLTRQLIRLLQHRTEHGYVFRVDVRLRPDPASTQIAISVPTALEYYEREGRNWERAALIKARVCAGDRAAGAAFIANLSPFIWRKYLDFVALSDIHEMKRQIHAYRGHRVVAVEGHNIKLGRGGIREIEFFVQTQQLIAGGRNSRLRSRETLVALRTLADGGWIDRETYADLQNAYEFLRTVEHRLQMVADEQTHTLPSRRDKLDGFARFLGYEDRDALAQVLLKHLRAVESRYASLFEHASLNAAERRGLMFPREADAKETLAKLGEMGFRHPVGVSAMVRSWLAGHPRGLKGEAAQAHFAELVPLLIDHIARAENPDAALAVFDRFLGNLHGGARLFSLLRQNPDLVALVARLLGTAPRLADTLALHPEVLDPLIDPAFFGALPGPERLTTALAASRGEADSYEDFLDHVRRFGQEQGFLIGTRILSGTVSASQAGEAFAAVADVIVRTLHAKVAEVVRASHGEVPGGDAVVLAMGKLGGREMTANSDLDLIVVYDFDPAYPESDGERRLHASHYFARFTQRLVNALTTWTNYGRLYDVDMRLRPSGRSGPVATSIASFESYQRHEAWTWEHLALTRARVVSGPPALAARVEAVINDVLRLPRDAQALASDVVDMRRAIAAEKRDDARWDLKYAAGGLIDLEFIAQYLQLAHAAAAPDILDTATASVFEKATREGILAAEDAEVLRPATRLYHNLGQILRLCAPSPFDPKSAGTALKELLARDADVPDFATLDAHLADTQERVRRCFVRILGRER